ILEMLEEHLDHVPFFERTRVLELVDRHGAFRLEADVEDDGGIGHAQYLRFDDLAFFDVGERPLVQLRHLRDFVRRILFVQVGADAEVGVSGSGGGSFGLRLGRVFRIYQHSGHRFGCGFGPMGPGTKPEAAAPAPAHSHLRVRSDLHEEYSSDEIAKMTELYEGTLSNIEEGEIVKSKVLRVTDTAVILDVGFKSEGAVPIDEFKDARSLKEGDVVEVFLEHLED